MYYQGGEGVRLLELYEALAEVNALNYQVSQSTNPNPPILITIPYPTAPSSPSSVILRFLLLSMISYEQFLCMPYLTPTHPPTPTLPPPTYPYLTNPPTS